MPDLIYLLNKWRRHILLLVVISVVTAAIIVFIQPNEYLGVATALPNNPVNADKAKLFGNNIQGLYSPLGSSDELDKVLGTASLDTIYIVAVQQERLVEHYKANSLTDAVHKLKKNSKIYKSEYGELKVKVWDVSNALAPQLANTLMRTLDSIHTNIINRFNRSSLMIIELMTAAGDSTRLNNYRLLADEYRVAIVANNSVLSVIEPARISLMPDRPKKLQVILAVFILSLLFGVLLALILERKAS